MFSDQFQLACFDRENVNWPPPAFVDPAPRKSEMVTPLIWCLLLLLSFCAQGEWPAVTSEGLVDSQAIFQHGEWWRPITGLFLHADLGHLLSNALSGIFVFSAVLGTIGRARGWIALGAAAILGNVVAAALVFPGAYRSLGASTAIFGGIGILTGRAIRQMLRANHPHRWRSLFVPAATGLIVLGLYGAGDQHVDVIAHATGFCAGVVAGLIAGVRRMAPV